jgi:hypothetical protein
VTDRAENDRDRAARLYAEARRLEERKEYSAARERYEQSLALHDDEEVEAAYLRVLSALGPA